MAHLLLLLLFGLLAACVRPSATGDEPTLADGYPHILPVACGPDADSLASLPTPGFTDAGAWFSFALPDSLRPLCGFCGPYSLYAPRPTAWAEAAVTLTATDSPSAPCRLHALCHQPGLLRMEATLPGNGQVGQQLLFADATTALLRLTPHTTAPLCLTGTGWHPLVRLTLEGHCVVARRADRTDEMLVLAFPPDVSLQLAPDGSNYRALLPPAEGSGTDRQICLSISLLIGHVPHEAVLSRVWQLTQWPASAWQQSRQRWQHYLQRLALAVGTPRPARSQVQALTVLVGGWRSRREGLLHGAILAPAGATDSLPYLPVEAGFVHAAALSLFAPQLAQSQLRALFDYQQPDGSLPCRLTLSAPVACGPVPSAHVLPACHAVEFHFLHTADTAFVAEMYPQLCAYCRGLQQAGGAVPVLSPGAVQAEGVSLARLARLLGRSLPPLAASSMSVPASPAAACGSPSAMQPLGAALLLLQACTPSTQASLHGVWLDVAAADNL
ncbi:MAG: hypothetical protein ACI37U_08040 [Bacteroides sp.]